MKRDKLRLLESEKVTKALFSLGIPTMIGMLVSALYNLADAFFVGKLGTDQVGAIAIVFPINQIVVGIGMTFGAGAASCISRMLGQNRIDRANETASTAVFLVTGLQVIIITISLIFLEPLLYLLGATDSILPYAKEYSLVYISGTFIMVFYVAMNNIVTAEGAAKLTMIAMMLGAGLNIVLDPVFIYLFNWGVRGAAWATLLSQSITALLYIVYSAGKRGHIHISVNSVKTDTSILKGILSVGLPIFFFQLLFGISQGMTNSAARSFGGSAVAAVGIVIRILSIGTFIIFGFIKGFQPLAGFAYGSNNFGRLKSITLAALKWTGLFSLFFACILVLFPENIMKWFSRDGSVISTGSTMLRANGVVFVLFGFQIVISTLFLSLGKGREGGILSIGRNGLFFIPVILIAPAILGINGVIYAQVIADVFTVLLTTALGVKLYKSLKRERTAHSIAVKAVLS